MTEITRYSGPATVLGIEPTGCDAVLMTLSAPALAAAAAPGQFVMLRLPGRNDPFLPRPFSVFDVSGTKIAEMSDVLGPGQKVAKYLSHASPGAGFFTQPMALGNGHVEVKTDYGLLGFELFFTESFSQLASVPAQTLK